MILQKQKQIEYQKNHNFEHKVMMRHID